MLKQFPKSFLVPCEDVDPLLDRQTELLGPAVFRLGEVSEAAPAVLAALGLHGHAAGGPHSLTMFGAYTIVDVPERNPKLCFEFADPFEPSYHILLSRQPLGRRDFCQF